LSIYAPEILRVLGQFFDAQDAKELEVLSDQDTLNLRWQDSQGASHACSFLETELRARGEIARRQRTHPFGKMEGRWAPALRTLGQELETEALTPLLVRWVAGGFQVYGVREGTTHPSWYALERLAEGNRARHTYRLVQQLRRTLPPANAQRSLFPLNRLT
jgi:hypothetical protein